MGRKKQDASLVRSESIHARVTPAEKAWWLALRAAMGKESDVDTILSLAAEKAKRLKLPPPPPEPPSLPRLTARKPPR